MGKKTLISILWLFWIAPLFAALEWEYDSKITVIETITGKETGDYLYEYSFVNTDTSVIWMFFVYTSFDTPPTDAIAGKQDWGAIVAYEPTYFRDYLDPSALDLEITCISGALYEYWHEPWNGKDSGIHVGETTTIFSFTTSSYDPSPKYYCYTTIETNGPNTYLQDTVSGVGQTVPEPATFALLCSGLLWLQRRKL